MQYKQYFFLKEKLCNRELTQYKEEFLQRSLLRPVPNSLPKSWQLLVHLQHTKAWLLGSGPLWFLSFLLPSPSKKNLLTTRRGARLKLNITLIRLAKST